REEQHLGAGEAMSNGARLLCGRRQGVKKHAAEVYRARGAPARVRTLCGRRRVVDAEIRVSDDQRALPGRRVLLEADQIPAAGQVREREALDQIPSLLIDERLEGD